MFEVIKPYISEIAQLLLSILAVFLIAALQQVKGRAFAWFEARTNATQRETLKHIGSEAFAHAETLFHDLGGAAKLQAATDYATRKLSDIGIVVTTEEIQAAIHKAWLDYNSQTKAKDAYKSA
ncbi:phage holin, LLH family [Paenibacillus naphthalenovorans]|uniref:phage holin, LLH family n=1 Tax=Paenibacillus naphthalenovorans TaxID=162209 RepID=UPI00088C3A80|nr:phage holin, LLH family [Paenibacillus naphthalenovorans]SDI48668.1 Bacteriophage holin of superfamily 6 (Holin_LLH) [Paenibacillus naphthalenovorans]